jgi:hypothetical protein
MYCLVNKGQTSVKSNNVFGKNRFVQIFNVSGCPVFGSTLYNIFAEVLQEVLHKLINARWRGLEFAMLCAKA